MAYNKRQKLQDNIEAIRIAFQVEKDSRRATAEEKAALRKYSGFGGLKFILNDVDRPERWSQSDRPFLPMVKELFEIIRSNSKDEKEYVQHVRSVRNSILSAFYTPQPVIDALSESLRKAGVEVRTMLDPSSGRGSFIESFREGRPEMEVTAFEKDLLTGKVLKALYPDVDVHVAGYETIEEKYRNRFDVASSNIPFGDVSVFDPVYSNSGNDANRLASKAIHNYFFLKTIDNVREGGIVAFITSQGVMDSPRNRPIREAMMQRAYLVGAVRLPNNLFSDEAGTDVGSDLIILQKDSLKNPNYTAYSPEERAFIDNINDKSDLSALFDTLALGPGEDALYRQANPNAYVFMSEHVWDGDFAYLGDHSFGKDQYGKLAIVSKWHGSIEDLGKALQTRLDGFMEYDLKKELYLENMSVQAVVEPVQEPVRAQKPSRKQQQPASQAVQLDLFAMWDAEEEQRLSMEPRPFKGKMLPHYRSGIIVLDSDQIGLLSDTQSRLVFKPMELPDRDKALLTQYVYVRDIYQELFSLEADTRVEQGVLRSQLNRYYDDFVRRFGPLNDRKNVRVIVSDALGRDMLYIENSVDGKFVKSDIFERPVSFNAGENDSVDNALDALFASLNRTGGVDLDYMAEISGIGEDDLKEQLSGRIFFNPQVGGYEVRDRFLAGNVIEKIDFFESNYSKESLMEGSDEYARSYQALLEVRPRPISFEELDFNFGERWMPTAYFEEFASQLYETDVRIKFAPNLDEFVVTTDSSTEKIKSEYAVHTENGDTIDGLQMMCYALYNSVPNIKKVIGYKSNGDPIKGTDHDRIQLAASKIDAIREAFAEWVAGHDQQWKQELADMYNRKFNCFVRPEYDGRHQTFPDLDFKSLKAKKNIESAYDSQKNAVWMLLQNAGGICDHEVGTGKTLIMCMAAHEMKCLGIAHKPIIIGMKANVSEIAATYQAAYPNARILYASEKDYSTVNRLQFFNRMKNNDYDCIIMSHDQFGMIPQSAEIQRDVLQEELQALEEALDVYESQGHQISGKMKSGLETRKQNLEAKLEELNHKLSQKSDDIVDFKTMGIDHIFVDESQAFKNLSFTTRDSRIAGLGNPKGSDRARNLMYAIRTIQQRTGKDLGATFLSGTTISNSLTELYLLFKYLRPQAMDAQDIHSFDAWAAVFATKTRDYEFNVAGQIVMKERFRKFIKVPELAAFYNENTDYKTAADVGLERPEMNVILVNIPPTEAHQDISRRLLEFANSGNPEYIFRDDLSSDEIQAKMLLVTNLGKKASLSPKLVNPALYGEGDDTKIGYAVRNISEYYHKYNEQKGTQFVFCDLSTPKKGEWTAYQEMKDRLVNDFGIPENEIFFMQDAGSEKRRKEVIAKMNSGEIRILFGSTTTLGTGVNAQQRCVAIHHMDLPWRPSDLEQRNGRGVRKGHEVAKMYADNKVDVLIYAVERSLDSYNFYLLQAKSDFIRQMKTGALGKRDFDMGSEDEENGMNFQEYVAITSGNTDLLERAKLEKKVLGLEAERKAFGKERSAQEYKLSYLKESIEKDERHLGHFYRDFEVLTGIGKDVFDPENPEHEEIGERAASLQDNGDGMDMMYVSQFEFTNRRTIDGLAADYGVRKVVNGAEYVVLRGEALGSYLQSLARVEVDGEVMIGSIERNPVKAWITMESVHQYNEKTGVNAYVGNRFFIKGEQLKYTWNEGKVNLRDRKEAAMYIPRAISRIPALIEEYEHKIAGYRQQVKELDVIISKPWPKADLLAEQKKSLQELDRKIQTEMDSTELVRQAGKARDALPFKIEQKSWGREPWELTFKKADYPFLTRDDFEQMENKYHGSIRSWGGDDEITGSFRHQFGAEQTMLELSKLNADRLNNVEWLADAVKDVHGLACMPAYHRLKEMGYDRYGHPLEEREANPISVYSLGGYADVRDLAHGVKQSNDIPINVAAKAFAMALSALPENVRQNAVIVPMPGSDGRSRNMFNVARKINELSGIDYIDVLGSVEHESLYDFKKQHPGEALPELFFALDGRQVERLAGHTPVIIDNVLDTGHTISSAVEAFDGQQPVVMVLGHTDNYQKYGYPIEVVTVNHGLDYIREATPEGVGFTGKTQDEIDALLAHYRNDGGWRVAHELHGIGLDEHTGYPLYLVSDITDKYEEMESDERRRLVKSLVEKGGLETLFTGEELDHLSERDKKMMRDELAFFVGKSEREYRFERGHQENLLVCYEVLRNKVNQALGVSVQMSQEQISRSKADESLKPSEDTRKTIAGRAVFTEDLIQSNMGIREDLIPENFEKAQTLEGGFDVDLARGFLKQRGLDWHTGYRLDDVQDIIDKWYAASDEECGREAARITQNGVRGMFTLPERNAISEADFDLLEECINHVRYPKDEWESEQKAVAARQLLILNDTLRRQYAFGEKEQSAVAVESPAAGANKESTLQKPFASQKEAMDFLAGIGYDGKVSRLLSNEDGKSFIKYFSNGVVTPNIYIGETTPMDVYRQFHLYGNIMEVDIPEDVRQVLDKEQDEALQARQDYWEMEREKVRYELNKQGIPFFDVVDCERGCRIVFTENKNDNGNYTDWYDVADAEAIGDDMAIAHIRGLAEKYAAATAEKFDAQAAEPETKQPEQKDIDATADYFFRVLQDNYPVMGVNIANRMEEVSALMAKEVLTWKLNISHETSASFWNQVATRLERQLFGEGYPEDKLREVTDAMVAYVNHDEQAVEEQQELAVVIPKDADDHERLLSDEAVKSDDNPHVGYSVTVDEGEEKGRDRLVKTVFYDGKSIGFAVAFSETGNGNPFRLLRDDAYREDWLLGVPVHSYDINPKAWDGIAGKELDDYYDFGCIRFEDEQSMVAFYEGNREEVDYRRERFEKIVTANDTEGRTVAEQISMNMPVSYAESQMAIVLHRDLDTDQVFIQNHSEDERKSLRYQAGETYEAYLKRNNIGISDSDRRLYMHDKYTDEQWAEIDGIFKAGFTKESASEVGRKIASLSFVGTKQEAYDILGLNRAISPETALPYFDGVSEHFRSIEPEMSPIMRQFHDLKAKHPDAVLLFRCGDFYESYEQDAAECARILGITLTRRGKDGTRMAGFPHHALDTYLPKLIRAGKRVAICDQLEDPKLSQRPVKRGITELVSPGEGVRQQVIGSMDDMKKVLPLDAVLRDALIERMRGVGIHVSTDVVEGERVLRDYSDLVRDFNSGNMADGVDARLGTVQDEYDRLLQELPEQYRQAQVEYEQYKAGLIEKYGEDYEKKFTEEEDSHLSTLLGEQWKLEPREDGYKTIAFNTLAGKYGADFIVAFGHEDGLLTVKDRLAASFVLGLRKELSDEQREQVEKTEIFKKWFGDWQKEPEKASKIVGADGRPLVVFHGTGVENAFTAFDREKGGRSNTLAKIGFWFTPSEDFARNWNDEVWYTGRLGGRVVPAFLDIKNPKVYRPLFGESAQQLEEIRDKRKAVRDEIKAIVKEYNYVRYSFQDMEAFNIASRNGFVWNGGDVFQTVKSQEESDRNREYYANRSEFGRQAIEDGEKLYSLNMQERQLEDQYNRLAFTDSYEQYKMDIYEFAGMRPGDAVIGGIGMSINNAAEVIEGFREKLKADGYDGIVIEDTKYDRRMAGTELNTQYIAFEPSQIKSATQNVGSFLRENDDIRYMFAGESVKPVFVSNALRAVERVSQEKATPEQWLRMIEKNGGLKAGEDRWTGLSDWLRGSSEKILTKQQVLDYLGANQIRIEEVRYADHSEAYRVFHSPKLDMMNEEFYELMADAEEETGSLYLDDHAEWAFRQMVERYGNDFRLNTEYVRGDDGWHLAPFEHYEGDGPTPAAADYYGLERQINDVRKDYTTAGLDNKREIALTVPTIESWSENDSIHFGDAGDGRAVAWVRFGDTTVRKDILYVKHVDAFLEPYENYRHDKVYIPSVENTKFGNPDMIVEMNPDAHFGCTGFYVTIDNNTLGDVYPTLDAAREAMNVYYKDHPSVRTGFEKVLVIDEVQSKRHQEGREKGYYSHEAYRAYNDYRQMLSDRYPEGWSVYNENAVKSGMHILTEDEQHRLSELLHVWNESKHQLSDASQAEINGIPVNDIENEFLRRNAAGMAFESKMTAKYGGSWHQDMSGEERQELDTLPS